MYVCASVYFGGVFLARLGFFRAATTSEQLVAVTKAT